MTPEDIVCKDQIPLRYPVAGRLKLSSTDYNSFSNAVFRGAVQHNCTNLYSCAGRDTFTREVNLPMTVKSFLVTVVDRIFRDLRRSAMNEETTLPMYTPADGSAENIPFCQ